MIEHLFTQFIRSLGIFFRTIRAFFTRKLVGLSARLRRLFNFSRNATKIAMSSLQGAAAMAQKPSKREDYIETDRLFISKALLLWLVAGAVALGLAVYFVIWPFVLSHFLTARFFVEDKRVENWTGRVILYYDKKKTVPMRSGRLTDGRLEGEGKEYDENGVLSYEGSFRAGLYNGTGSAYENGVLVYTGDYAEGLRSGTGKLYTNGNLFYEGQFQADVPSGEGTSYYAGGGIAYRGEFANGVFEGQGTSFSRQGTRMYEGGFSGGLYNGQGSLYLSRRERITAVFSEGEPEGAVRWLKNGILYYEGEWGSTCAEGFGKIYTQTGNVLYEGRVTGGTLDGPWLLDLGLDEFRSAMGEGKLTEETNPGGGFTITSTALGLTAQCRFRQDGTDASVQTVGVFQAQGDGKDWVELLPERLTGSGVWTGEVEMPAVQGIPLPAGTYQAQEKEEESYWQLLLFNESGSPVLYQCGRREEELPEISGPVGFPADEAGDSRTSALLASLDLMEDTGAAAANGGTESNPYLGSTDPGSALAACQDGEAGAQLMNALLLYWENAERRTAAENNLARTQQLLDDAAALGGSTDTLEAACMALADTIETCAHEMSKAAMAAQTAANADPAAYDAAAAAVMFDPAQLNTENLALTTAAYVQGKGGTVDPASMALDLKTALVDLSTSYQAVQAAIRNYEDAGNASQQAATAYAMETGSKTGWFTALSAKEDSRAALVAAISSFSRQANELNRQSGGWVSRSCGWYASEFTELFQLESQEQPVEQKPLEERLEEILQGIKDEEPPEEENAPEQAAKEPENDGKTEGKTESENAPELESETASEDPEDVTDTPAEPEEGM